jgi:hypothetical protein
LPVERDNVSLEATGDVARFTGDGTEGPGRDSLADGVAPAPQLEAVISLLLGMFAGLIVGKIFIRAGVGDNGFLSGVVSGGAAYILQLYFLLNYLVSNPVILQ